MSRVFELTYPAPLSSRVRSRDACTYLYRGLKFLGWIPPERGAMRYVYLLWAFLVFSIAGIYIPIGFNITLAMDFEIITPGEFLYVIQTFLNATGVATKCICGTISLSRQDETRLLLDQLDKTVHAASDRQKIHNAVALSNKVFLLYSYCYFAYTISAVLVGAIIGRPPWMFYNPFFNWRNGNLHFWFNLAFEYIIGSLTVFMAVVWDSYTLIYVTIFRAHIDILKDHVQKLRTNPLVSETENYDELVGCITKHQLILK